jgi:hypothetical protein
MDYSHAIESMQFLDGKAQVSQAPPPGQSRRCNSSRDRDTGRESGTHGSVTDEQKINDANDLTGGISLANPPP